MESEALEDRSVKRHYAMLDISLILFWFLLSGTFYYMLSLKEISIYTLAAGVAAASAVTLTAHEFVIQGEEREKSSLSEYLVSLNNVITLVVDVIFKLIVANGVLIYQSLTMDIEPRIVKVKVDLTSESEITLISLLISLVPGTFVMDVEKIDGEYYLYVHFSYLKSDDLGESMESTIKRWDKKIRGLFK
ncbi:MAG: Na+/H+ antiporter subunit E [Thermoplasmata archaeon]